MRRLLVLCVSLLGCAPGEGTPGDLADILREGSSELVLSASGDELTLQYSADLTCVRLVPTMATVNGEVLQARSLGSGTPWDGARVPRDQCVRPSWIVPPRPADEAVSEFVLSDPSAEIRARLQAVGTRPTATLVVPDRGVRPGQRIELEWTPATDLLRPQDFVFSFESDAGVSRWNSPAAIASARLPLEVPADARSGTLSISGRPAAGVERCEPAQLITCSFVRPNERLDVALTIEP